MNKYIDQWSPEEATPEGGWWAVCDRCNDECAPFPPVALFRRLDDAYAYIKASDPDDAECHLVFDACVLPAAILNNGVLAVSNDYEIRTHAGLAAALAPPPKPALGPPCECGGTTLHLGDDWACVKCGRHGGVADDE